MSSTDRDRRRLRLAWSGGGGVGLVLFGWLLTAGRWSFLERRQLDDLYDAQGRAFLDGRLDVPPQVVGIEGFVDGGRTHMYFGPLPALLRMPVLAVTDRFDGRLTSLSMLAAVVVLVAASYRLSGALRDVVRGAAPVGWAETWATVVLAVAVVLGPPITLASASVIYHEAIVWGLALSVAGFDAVARWQREPGGRRLAWASALILLALLSRACMGLGPLVALGLAGGSRLGRQWRWVPRPRPALAVGAAVALDVQPVESPPSGPRWPGGRQRRLLGEAALLLLALLVPLVLSMGLHQAKLGTPVGLPFDRQVAWNHSPEIREWFEATRAPSLSHLRRTVPTYFRPVGLELRRSFPWVDFPRDTPAQLNDGLPVDVVDWSSSLPTTAPAFGALSVAGVVWAVRTRRWRDRATRLWPLLVGALAPIAVVLTYPFVAHRYLNDLYLLVLLGGLVGFHSLLAAAVPGGPQPVLRRAVGDGVDRPGWSRPALRRAVAGGMGLTVLMGCGLNLVLALELQRERWYLVPESWRSEWIRWRVDLPGAPEPLRIDVDQPFPPALDGGLLVVGDCQALYTGVGPPRDVWMPVDRSICEDIAAGEAPK